MKKIQFSDDFESNSDDSNDSIMNDSRNFDNSGVNKKLVTTIESIDVYTAKEYLSTMGTNRPINDRRVNDYVKRMEVGDWQLGQPITFDEDDNLIDGQHRLEAVVKYGKPIKFCVLRGLPSESKTVFDMGQPRTVSQIAAISGCEKKQLSNRFAILRAAFYGATLKAKNAKVEKERNARNLVGDIKGIISPQALMRLEEKYSDALDFAVSVKGNKTDYHCIESNALIKSVFFRAYHHVNHDRLEEFMVCYYTGQMKDGERDYVAGKFRNYVIRLKQEGGLIAAAKLETYVILERSILAFMAGKKQNLPYIARRTRYDEHGKFLPMTPSSFPELIEEFPLADFD